MGRRGGRVCEKSKINFLQNALTVEGLWGFFASLIVAGGYLT